MQRSDGRQRQGTCVWRQIDFDTNRKEGMHSGSLLNNKGCMFCGTELKHTFVDLGMSPLCESYVPYEKLNQMELFYPLHAFVCSECFLVQLDEYVSPEHIFSEYAYFSSYADSWVQHMKVYADMIVQRFALNASSFVVELASNDGYLLQHF